jgi:hypothetical protein
MQVRFQEISKVPLRSIMRSAIKSHPKWNSQAALHLKLLLRGSPNTTLLLTPARTDPRTSQRGAWAYGYGFLGGASRFDPDPNTRFGSQPSAPRRTFSGVRAAASVRVNRRAQGTRASGWAPGPRLLYSA